MLLHATIHSYQHEEHYKGYITNDKTCRNRCICHFYNFPLNMKPIVHRNN